MRRLKKLKHLSSILIILFYSCDNKKNMKDEYLAENQVDVSIGYYVYDKKLFDTTLEDIHRLEKSIDVERVKEISKELITCLAKDVEEIKRDNEFKTFYNSISLSNSAEKYVDLYHNLSLSRLQKVSDGEFSFDQNEESYENYVYFRDCYLRRMSAFYNEK